MIYEYEGIIRAIVLQNGIDNNINRRNLLQELDEVYILAKKKASEYEAKAKAYNDALKTLDKLINDDERYKEARSNDFVAGMLIAYENIFNLMEDYIKESGESDAKK